MKMKPPQFKIVVSGAVGSGKTTLVQALSKKLDLPVIPENMGLLYHSLDLFRKAQRSPTSTAADKKDKCRSLMKCFSDWAHERQLLYTNLNGFIADRWEADLLDLWLKLFADLPCDPQTAQLLDDMRRKSKLFDCAIMLPPGTFQAGARNEDGLTRRQTLNLTLLSTLVTGGLHRQCPDLSTLHLPPKIMEIEERMTAVISYAQKHHKAGARLG